MSDGLNPTGPSQPTLDQAYTTAGNPATTSGAEDSQAAANASSDSTPVDHRTSARTATEDQAEPSSLGQGSRAPLEKPDGTEEDRAQELEAEQMAAPGEGKVADAVARKPGAGGSAPGLETDLQGKKEEQAGRRGEVQGQRHGGEDVGGEVGGRGGPAEVSDSKMDV